LRKVSHLWLNFSSAQAYSRCKRKFFLSLIKGLDPITFGDNTLAASFRGTLVHAALDARARKIAWEPVVEALIEEGSALRAHDENRSGSLKHIKSLISRYFDQYASETISYKSTEQTLQMPISSRVTWVGTIDKIGIDAYGSTFVMDHKCSSSLRQWIEPTIALSDQFTGYLALAKANGANTNLFVVDGISTALKALDDGVGLFVRYETERTDEQIGDFLNRMQILGDEIIDFVEHNETLQENISLPTPACNEYGTKCAFWDVCTASGLGGSNILRNAFRKTLNPRKNFRILFEDEKA
jgi:PD-(D/E)XK nuclease superfamily protein